MKWSVIFIFVSLQTLFAQDPQLTDNQWYVDYLEIDGTIIESPISGLGIFNTNIDFKATMFLAVVDPESDYLFGDIAYDVPNNAFTFTNMGITLPGCQAYCDFAIDYFNLLGGDLIEIEWNYLVEEQQDESLRLTLTNSNGDRAVYNDFPPLGMDQFDASSIVVFPNPVSEQLFITSEIGRIEGIELYNNQGQRLKFEHFAEGVVDLSHLAAGHYFVVVTSEYGSVVKKLLKQ